ncbi:MAG: hypothetical protein LRY53_11805 [Burkholderiaceae bacterium]|nr:hypothetical protein [Burkholderiaceae bacterium]MCD8517359.1 hypothetical protein [Burkholderiaceae bacterium]MCD8538123.1 hypothetical protein [Burkholderiaceae bacterium]MCD8566271.1 hypothetical protein [Burkholderiaceae bacterium]
MMDLLNRLVRVIAFALVALIGLGMALIFTFSTLIAVGILFVAAKLRGQRFSVQEYWTSRQSRRKPIFTKGGFAQQNYPRDNVTDVEARDVR